MKVLICGSRGISDRAIVSQAIKESGMCPTQIISGGARGVDNLAGEFAAANDIEFVEYLAAWDKYGKRARFMRNYIMVGEADAVTAVWDGKSSGTKHSIELARSSGKPVYVYTPGGPATETRRIRLASSKHFRTRTPKRKRWAGTWLGRR